ncbi:MAG TPA: trypsin-like peptidase domain-containing protein [Ferruginibacter sp.]|nr:trypsin-like peptidase domain-containing protein [Ferruginibacter sp.]
MRNIPDDNLAYPVLITLNTGFAGSGFQLNSGTNTYFITAKHVLFDNNSKIKGASATLICQSKDIDDDSTTILSIDLTKLKLAGQIFTHPTKDVAAIAIGHMINLNEKEGYTTKTIDGVSVTQNSKTPIVSVDGEKSVAFLKDVLISNDIFLYGYPSSLGLRQSPKFDYEKPLLRKGIVASVNKIQGTIILDCPVYYGNSGGPVVQVRNEGAHIKHDVIGVVSEFIPYSENWKNQSNGITHTEISNSGYSVAVAMDFVYEMLNIKK